MTWKLEVEAPMTQRSRSARKVAGLIAALSVVALIVAGGGMAAAANSATQTTDMNELIAAAKKEGTVLLYTIIAADKLPAWVKPFEEKYGINVKSYRAASNALYSRFSQEESAGRHLADLIGLSEPLLIAKAIRQDLAAKYIIRDADKFPPVYVLQGIAYPLYLIAHGFAWNTAKITPQQKQQLMENGFQALLDPSLKGSIALVGPVGGGQEASYYEIVRDPNLGWAYLEKLAAQRPTIINSAITMTTGLSSGEYTVGFPSSDTSIWPALAQGAPVEFAYSDPSVTSEEQIFISKNAPHPNAARLFMEWATSLEGQTGLGHISSGIMARTDWKDDRPIAKQKFYRPPAKLDNAWSSDPKFATDIEGIIKRWESLFGQR
jgi:iron(III) transport system substrate-binding protein